MTPQVSTRVKSDEEDLISGIIQAKFNRKIIEIVPQPGAKKGNIYVVCISPAIENASAGVTIKESFHQTTTLPKDADKVIVRFTTPDANLNDEVVVQSEVASMALARDALQCLPIIPNVYDWSPAVSGNGWILMEFMPGVPLSEDLFGKLDKDAQKSIVEQVAHILGLFQNYTVPDSIRGYGGLSFAKDGSIVTGPTPIHGSKMSCETYYQLYHQYANYQYPEIHDIHGVGLNLYRYLQTQLDFMDKCKVVRGWKDSELRARINNFVANGFEPLLRESTDQNPRQTFVHGDLDIHNLLFDPSTKHLTGLLDFRFSHIASAADEFFYSFDSIQSLVSPAVNEGPRKRLRNLLLRGFDATVAERENEQGVDWKLASLTDNVFQLAGVKRPIDMMPGMETQSSLYWFIQNISPGAFFLPGFIERMPPKKTDGMREEIMEDLGKNLALWEF